MMYYFTRQQSIRYKSGPPNAPNAPTFCSANEYITVINTVAILIKLDYD